MLSSIFFGLCNMYFSSTTLGSNIIVPLENKILSENNKIHSWFFSLLWFHFLKQIILSNTFYHLTWESLNHPFSRCDFITTKRGNHELNWTISYGPSSHVECRTICYNDVVPKLIIITSHLILSREFTNPKTNSIHLTVV